MSSKGMLEDYKTWLGIAAAMIAGIWAYLTNKKKNKAAEAKDNAEEDSIRFNTFLGRERRLMEKEKNYEERIESLIAKLEKLTKELEECQQLKQDLLLLNKELNAEKNLWMTVNS